MDINADQDKIKVMLNDLQLVLDDLQKRAFQFKSYQKNFKVITALRICFQNVCIEMALMDKRFQQ